MINLPDTLVTPPPIMPPVEQTAGQEAELQLSALQSPDSVSTPPAEKKFYRILIPYRPGYPVPASAFRERAEQLKALENDPIATASGEAYADSAAMQHPAAGLIFESPASPGIRESRFEDNNYLFSWVSLGIIAIFVAVCFKYSSNSKYLISLKRDLFDVRERHNLFDETVTELSFMMVLNALCAVSLGVVLFAAVTAFAGSPGIATTRLLICEAVGVGYCMGMPLIYWAVGNIFTDSATTRRWLRGFGASQSVLGILLLPVSLLIVFYPQWWTVLLLVGAGAIILSKLIFIFKGFRIFMDRASHVLLFLYYLCGLELVPLVACYVLASTISGQM